MALAIIIIMTNHTSEIKRLGLIAGEGQLPVFVAENAKKQGIDVVPFSIAKNNRKELKTLCNGNLHCFDAPGMLEKNLATIQSEEISHIVFAGKVNKWILLRNPKLDKVAVEALAEAAKLNDDTVMLWLVDNLKMRGLEVLPQTDFLENLFLAPCLLTNTHPDLAQLKNIEYGLEMAKEMGRLDIGQTIVVKDRMVIAVEAIEGTDECIKRSKQLIKGKGGAVVKVAKPDQDNRFDVPTVGLRTLKSMRKAGLNCLATEANETLFLEPEAMSEYANKHGMIILSTSPDHLQMLIDTTETQSEKL